MTNNCWPSRAPKNSAESRDSTSKWTESEKGRKMLQKTASSRHMKSTLPSSVIVFSPCVSQHVLCPPSFNACQELRVSPWLRGDWSTQLWTATPAISRIILFLCRTDSHVHCIVHPLQPRVATVLWNQWARRNHVGHPSTMDVPGTLVTVHPA